MTFLAISWLVVRTLRVQGGVVCAEHQHESANCNSVVKNSGVNGELEFIAIQQAVEWPFAGESLGKLEDEGDTFPSFVHDGGAV